MMNGEKKFAATADELTQLKRVLEGAETDLEAIVEDAEILSTRADTQLGPMIDGIRSVAVLRLALVRDVLYPEPTESDRDSKAKS
jgi:hypothetical protein